MDGYLIKPATEYVFNKCLKEYIKEIQLNRYSN